MRFRAFIVGAFLGILLLLFWPLIRLVWG